jgi:3-oxoacyl-[acyl-carrier protein] reductase
MGADSQPHRGDVPRRSLGAPDDVANLVEFLVSDAGGWVRGQVLDSEGGFDRFSSVPPAVRD